MLKGRCVVRVCQLAAVIIVGALPGVSCQQAPTVSPAPPLPAPSAAVATRVQWLGQACFLITSSAGLKIMTDPYTPGANFPYSAIDESADVVTVSHEHGDHNNVAGVKGSPRVIKGSGVKNGDGIEFTGLSIWHDAVAGAQRGPNTVFLFSVDGIRFAHLGDLGHVLAPEQVTQIGRLDVLFIPVGGFFTIDAGTASEVASQLKPRIVMPMHYRSARVTGGTLANLSPVDDFLKGKDSVKRVGGSTYEIKSNELPASTLIVVLDPAR